MLQGFPRKTSVLPLLLALAGAASLLAVTGHEQTAAADYAIEDANVKAQVEKAEAQVRRCDVTNATKAIEGLEQTVKVLKEAHAIGVVKGADRDARFVEKLIRDFKAALLKCPKAPTAKTTTGVSGETYAFVAQDDADAAATAIADAKRFARDCDRKGYQDNIKALDAQAERVKVKEARIALFQLARDLEAAAAELFKHCVEPAKTDPPKTGAGSTQPNKPPEPPKAPASSPDHGSVPNFKFNGELFANVNWVSQFGAGTVINGGRHAIVDSPGTLTGAGFRMGLDLPSRMNPFGTGRDPWWSIDVGFARATGSTSGAVAPGAATTGFDYIRPNPASGLVFLSHFLNGQVVTIDSERNQLDVEVLHNVKWQMTLNTMIPATPIETSLGIGMQFRAIWDTHKVNQSIINVPDVTSIIDLDSSTYFIGPKIMGRAEYEMGRWEFYVGAYVSPGLAIGSGRAEQQARCPVCAASEQSVNLGASDSFVRFAVNAGARAWVSYAITPAVTARAFAGYDYFSHAARWQLDPGNAQLRTGSAGTFRVGVGLSLRF